MDFWSTFIEESLQSPWILRPESLVNAEAQDWPNQKIFIFEEGLPDGAYEMLSKMVLALKYQPEEVTFFNASAGQLEVLQNLNQEKRLLFFGTDYPGMMGQWQNWYGHQVLKTHSLQDLLKTADLKKETWMHLKSYAGLK